MALVVLGTSGTAWAADPPDDAKTFFAEGRRLRLAGDCAAAVVQFELAREAYPEGLGSLRNIAECQEEMGQTASARRSWWALRRDAMARPEPRYEGWQHDAETAYARLEGRVPKLVIVLEGDVAGVEVTIDGRGLDAKLAGEPLERNPGTHRVVVRRAGEVLHAGDVQLRPAETERVEVVVPDAPLPPTAPTVEPAPGPSGLFIGGLVGVGLGAASFMGAGVAVAMRQDALSDLDRQCPTYDTGLCASNSDADAIASTVARGQSASTATNVLLVVGGVTSAIGLSLLMVDLTADTSEPEELSLSVHPNGLWLQGSF